MHGKTVTIYGGSGFIGRYITKELAELGAIIRVGVRHLHEASFLKPMGSVAQITPIFVDINNQNSVDESAKNADILINCVGILTESGNAQFDSIHHKGAQYIAEAAQKWNVERLIHFSALGANPNSASHYALTKALGEQAVLKAFPAATILRPSIVFGPEDNFFNRFAALAQMSFFIPLIGGGHTKFQPVYVSDIAHFVASVLQNKACQSAIYEIGGPKVYSFKELMQLMLTIIDRKKCLVSLSFGFAKVLSYILQFLPGKMLTPDQVKLLRDDNICSGNFPGLESACIDPTPLEIILPAYLSRYRPGGRYIKLPRLK